MKDCTCIPVCRDRRFSCWFPNFLPLCLASACFSLFWSTGMKLRCHKFWCCYCPATKSARNHTFQSLHSSNIQVDSSPSCSVWNTATPVRFHTRTAESASRRFPTLPWISAMVELWCWLPFPKEIEDSVYRTAESLQDCAQPAWSHARHLCFCKCLWCSAKFRT